MCFAKCKVTASECCKLPQLPCKAKCAIFYMLQTPHIRKKTRLKSEVIWRNLFPRSCKYHAKCKKYSFQMLQIEGKQESEKIQKNKLSRKTILQTIPYPFSHNMFFTCFHHKAGKRQFKKNYSQETNGNHDMALRIESGSCHVGLLSRKLEGEQQNVVINKHG